MPQICLGRTCLYCLPSSIHESLLIADDGSVGVSDLYEMVETVNRTCVSEDEIVSNSVYFYDRKEDRLSIAKGEGLCAGF